MVRSVLLVALLVALSCGTPATADQGRIQPGDLAISEESTCTLGFVFDGPEAGTYFVTSAHCVDHVGEDIETTGSGIFGDVAWIGNPNSAALDFAFVKVRQESLGAVDPSVRGHPGYPTGSTVATDTDRGDRIQVSGFGHGFSLTFATQTRREGIHLEDTGTVYEMAGLDVWGDSGGPLVHKPTGKAYGIVSRFCTDACTSTGPTVEGILHYAAELGFPVTLRTV